MSISNSILVVDDDAVATELLTEVLSKEGFRVQGVCSGAEAVRLAETASWDLVITDLRMPDAGGLDVVRAFKQRSPRTLVIVITAFGSMRTAVEAIQNGAYDYISKPFRMEEIKLTVRRALEQQRLLLESAPFRPESPNDLPFENVIGKSPKMLEIYKLVARVANSDTTVLIQGESGTGKELIARSIHNHSLRAAKPFVAVNCAALSEGLLESELFGHVKGAFTGAQGDKKGLFEEANKGTCFLDEIGEITPALQTKLLRVLQEHEIRRVGGSENIAVDVRVVAATNKDLASLVRSEKFREDLFYRLHVVTINLPPLREHPDDIPLLVNFFLQKYNRRAGKRITSVSEEAMEALLRYPWPGNIRELENVIERAVTLTTNAILLPSDLSEELFAKATPSPEALSTSPVTLEQMKLRYIQQILDQTGGNQIKAAEILGINRKTLYRLVKRDAFKTKQS